MKAVAYYPVDHPDEVARAAYAEGQIFVQLWDGRRFAIIGSGDDCRRIKNSPYPRRLFLEMAKARGGIRWAGQRCDLSPCTSDAAHVATQSGITYMLCGKCARTPLFSGVEFCPATFTIPGMDKR